MSFYNEKITFIHIPRTTGLSIKHWLKTHCNSPYREDTNHPKYSTFLGDDSKNFSFTVVRNPWDRMVSMYRYLRVIAQSNEYPTLLVNDITNKNFPSFYTWLDRLHTFKKHESLWFDTSTQQIEWFDLKIDTVVKFENYDNDMIQIKDYLNLYADIPKINSSSRMADYKYYYNTKTKNIVGKAFENDIETFNYKF
jgi:hypothetical protein